MAQIRMLEESVIDQIAAGEVVERPASVVKELVENACDAGAGAVTVEIRDGGTTFIRVTDNGSGIENDQVQRAFYRHATSKIQKVEDLFHISSLGFRGEALSSIAAVSLVEMITKTKDALTGVRYCIEGGRERELSEVGAPEGTTVIIRDLFFNTPARRKFLKTPATEGSHVADLMEHLALARPDISFSFVQNRQPRFSTSGSGDLKEVVYRIYGREIAKELFPFSAEKEGLRVDGFLGTPQLVRPNRNFEFFFVNRRYIRSQLLSAALESGYASRLMQHKFPVAWLHLTVDPSRVDVNVHPSKMEVRFSEGRQLSVFLEEQIRQALHEREMIPTLTLSAASGRVKGPSAQERTAADGTEKRGPTAPARDGTSPSQNETENREGAFARKEKENGKAAAALGGDEPRQAASAQSTPESGSARELAGKLLSGQLPAGPMRPPQPFERRRISEMAVRERLEYEAVKREDEPKRTENAEQLNLFSEKLLSPGAVRQYELIGQIFGTYWIASYQDKMILIDQHAAHEKVKYEALIKKIREGRPDSQNLMPPAVVTLTNGELTLLERYREYFSQAGFEIEPFGGNACAVRAMPCDLYGSPGEVLLRDILNGLETGQRPGTPAAVTERIASMACKAAVKGNHRMERAEMEALLDQLLTLDNPYQCPHGRPTMITMSRQELERKFKRIV